MNRSTEICIENGTTGYGEVIARASRLRMRIYPGKTVCETVQVSRSRLVLRAKTQGGGMRGPLSFEESVTSFDGCWRWRLTNTQDSLLPC